MLEHHYWTYELSSGLKKLKGRDAVIGRHLIAANESLPEDEQYDFYVGTLSRCIMEDGNFRIGSSGGISVCLFVCFCFFLHHLYFLVQLNSCNSNSQGTENFVRIT